MKRVERRALGFTLLEVMLALGILSFAGLMIYEHGITMLTQQRMLEEKTWATWLAQNELNRRRIGAAIDPASPLATDYLGDGGIEAFVGLEWRVEVDEHSTSTPLVNQRIVEVYRSDDHGTGEPMARLITLEWAE